MQKTANEVVWCSGIIGTYFMKNKNLCSYQA